jgi:hypothetical protein
MEAFETFAGATQLQSPVPLNFSTVYVTPLEPFVPFPTNVDFSDVQIDEEKRLKG